MTDLQIYDAVLPPPFIAVADNAISYSDKEHGNTLMAGVGMQQIDIGSV